MRRNPEDYCLATIAIFFWTFALSLGTGWLGKLAALPRKDMVALVIAILGGVATFLWFFLPIYRAGIKPVQYVFSFLGMATSTAGVLLFMKIIPSSLPIIKAVHKSVDPAIFAILVCIVGVVLTLGPMYPSYKRAKG